MHSFRQFIEKQKSKGKQLPVFHTCDSYDFRNILKRQKLNPHLCDVFGEKLLYFFYGRPSYRLSNTNGSTSLASFYPVCLMLRADQLPPPKRIVPFDTGAFDSLLKENFFHPKMRMKDFFLNPDIESPSKLISLFYETNEKYILGVPKESIVNPALLFEVDCYLKLITFGINSTIDDRKDTIEVQINRPIELSKSIVDMIVVPNFFLDDDFVLKTFDSWDVEVDSYPTFRSNPREYHGAIFEKTLNYLRKSNRI